MSELLKNPFERFGQSIRSYCPATRWIAVGFVLLIVVSLVWLLGGGALPPVKQRELLFCGQKFSDSDLIAMESAFAQARLTDYKIVEKTVEIPAQKRMVYIAALADAKSLPRNFNQHLDEIVGEISLFDAPATRDLKLKIGRQKALAEIINSMDGLSQAAVLWDIEKIGGLSPKTIVRASVTLRTDPGTELSDIQVQGIRQMVAHAVAGLQPGNVAVSDLRTGICYALDVPPPVLASNPGTVLREAGVSATGQGDYSRVANQNSSSGFFTHDFNLSNGSSSSHLASDLEKDPDCKRRMRAETFWNQKIARLLSVYVPGALVQSTVEFAEFQSQLEKRVEHDAEPTIYRSVVEENTDRSIADSQESRGTAESADSISNSRSNDAPLSVAFGVNQPRSLEQRGSLATITSTVRKTEDGILGGKVTVTQKDPAAGITVSATIAVPQEYLVQVCRRQFQLTADQIPSSDQIRLAGEVQVQRFLKLVGNILPQRTARETPERFLHFVFTDLSAGDAESLSGPAILYGAVPLYEQQTEIAKSMKSATNISPTAEVAESVPASNKPANFSCSATIIANNNTGEKTEDSKIKDYRTEANANPVSQIPLSNPLPVSESVSDIQANPRFNSDLVGLNQNQDPLQKDNATVDSSASSRPTEQLTIKADLPQLASQSNGQGNDKISERTTDTTISAKKSSTTPEFVSTTAAWLQSIPWSDSAFWLRWPILTGIAVVAISLIILLLGLYRVLTRFFVRRLSAKKTDCVSDAGVASDGSLAEFPRDFPSNPSDVDGKNSAGARGDNSGTDINTSRSTNLLLEASCENNPALELLDQQEGKSAEDTVNLNQPDTPRVSRESDEPDADIDETNAQTSRKKGTYSANSALDESADSDLKSSILKFAPQSDSGLEAMTTKAAGVSPSGPSREPSAVSSVFQPNPETGKKAVTDREQGQAQRSSSCDFTDLEAVESSRLAQILSVERPQTAALALSQLSDEKAGEVLAFFSQDYRPEVVQRLLRLESPAPEILADVKAALCERAKRFIEGDENPARLDCKVKSIGKERMSRILAASDINIGRQILSSLKQVDETLVDEWAPDDFRFEDLANLDPKSLNNLFSAAEPEEVLLSFVGVPAIFLNKIAATLPSQCGQRLKKDLWEIGPTRLSDVEEARRRIVQLARDLVIQGRVRLNGVRTAKAI